MSTENSEPNFNIPLTSEPEKHDQKQAPENNDTDIMFAKLGQQQVENLNLFKQNVANHLNIFLSRLEEADKDKSIPVTDAETGKHSCSKATANNGDENNKKMANKHSLAVKDENPRNKRKRLLSSLEGNKKHHYDNSSCKYEPNSGVNASDSNNDDDNEINVNKSDVVSIQDQEDMDPRIKKLTGEGSEEYSDDSGNESQSDSDVLQQTSKT